LYNGVYLHGDAGEHAWIVFYSRTKIAEDKRRKKKRESQNADAQVYPSILLLASFYPSPSRTQAFLHIPLFDLT
jgi:hypothetical protein